MNKEQFEEKYINRYFHEGRLAESYSYLGKYGKATFYQFTLMTQNAVLSVDVCTEHGQITGLVPEKTPVEDEYGYMDESVTEEILDREYDLIGLQLDPVLISAEEAKSRRAGRNNSPMSQAALGMGSGEEMFGSGFDMNAESGMDMQGSMDRSTESPFSDPWGMAMTEDEW